MFIAAPSILSADFSKLLEEVKDVSTAKFLHIDVMDGHFVPNITIGPLIVKSIKGKVDMVFDCHLMISDPKKYTESFAKSGADIITFQYEALNSKEEILDLIDYIHSFKIHAGISIKPNTSVDVLDDEILSKVDLVLVMSVEPGFGGQKFMENSLPKIKKLRELKDKFKYNYIIEVDGGINKETAVLVKKAGVEAIVAGTYVFKSQDRKETIKELEKNL